MIHREGHTVCDIGFMVYLEIHSLISKFFSKKVKIFIPVEPSSVENISCIIICLVKIRDGIFINIVTYCSKLCITCKRCNITIDWKFINNLVLCTSTEIHHKIIVCKAQNMHAYMLIIKLAAQSSEWFLFYFFKAAIHILCTQTRMHTN